VTAAFWVERADSPPPCSDQELLTAQLIAPASIYAFIKHLLHAKALVHKPPRACIS